MRVRLEPVGVEVELAPGQRLVDALDERAGQGEDVRRVLAALPTVCRAGNCGMCWLQVEGELASFQPAGPHEARMLTRLAAGAQDRLGCQLHAADSLHRGAAPVTLRLRR